MRPLIGVTVNYDFRDRAGLAADTGLEGQSWHLLSGHYLEALERAGAAPVMLPVTKDPEEIAAAASRLDGVMLTGGADVAPVRFGARIKEYCGRIIPERDEMEILLCRFLMEKSRIPVLGICRGIQVMNIAAGGTIWQDLTIEGGFERHYFHGVSPCNNPVHSVRTEEDSRLREIYGAETVAVNSFHHQAVRDLAPGYRAAAFSEDGVIEGIELSGDRFVVGVQWHPEMMYDSAEQQKLFLSFTEACRK